MNKRLDPKRIAAALAEAAMVGDQAVAKKYGVSDRTVRSWRTRRGEPEVQKELATAQALVADDWAEAAVAFLKVAIAKLEELCQKATGPEHIHAVAGATKIVGELQVVKDALRVEQPEPDSARPEAPGAGEREAKVIPIQR